MEHERFNHTEIEKAAQKKWDDLKIYETNLHDTSKDPYYLLFEFPYPSGDLHIGHWYAYAVTDIYARMLRMQGKNVLFPIGFDAFGLPAENAAMKQGANPREWTFANMEKMRAQIKSIGASLDWSKEVVTCDPSYYHWTQWLFAKLYEHKLAYRAEAPVKWCPKDQTVLANEQVIDGKCERCGTEVEEKRLTQWFMNIKSYADRLLADLDELPWREDIKDAQRAWIGRSEGAKLWFPLSGRDEKIDIFTTRPDTVFGATYAVLAPEHPLVDALLADIENRDAVQAYRDETARKTERERSENKEKTGVKLEGVMAMNPATKEEIPVYIADYVLASYGTGAVMAVPAHDERDFAFAKKMSLPTKIVIEDGKEGECYGGDGTLVNSGDFSGKNNRLVFNDIVTFAGGEPTTNYRIRDWLVSRQRYWGCPIPVVYDPEGNAHIVPAEHLPWLLPEDVDLTVPNGQAPLSSSKELKERVTRIFGEGWTPEYDTLDTFVDSSWYFLRYLDPKNANNFSDMSVMERWLPVKRYSGGSEHTTMHLLYARFFHKALYDLSLVPTKEPFEERYNRGLILGPDGQKMSKRWGNVVNPDDMLKAYGADAVRMYLAFVGPYNEPGHYPWKLDGVEAMRRLLDRIYALSLRVKDEEATDEARRAVAKAVSKVAVDGERFKFNTALSAIMVLINELSALPVVSKEIWKDVLRLLAPFAPHLAEHMWDDASFEGSVHANTWPVIDSSLLTSATVAVVVQVNGKRRGEVMLAPDASEDDAKAAALTIPAVAAALGGNPQRVIYVPGRILNLVGGSG